MTLTSAIKTKSYFKSVIKFAFLYAILAVAAHAATYTVTNTNDSGNGSLRTAILNANADTDAVVNINFNIGASGGSKSIVPTSALPAINSAAGSAVNIDGTTQPGWAGVPIIELNGGGAGAGANGLTIFKGYVTVKGLIISNFDKYGIFEYCESGSCSEYTSLVVYGSYIGTTSTGNAANGNGGGIYLQPSTLNHYGNHTTLIGGTGANQRNIISGNEGAGIVLAKQPESVKIVNNYIGTNVAGNAAVPNGGDGIQMLDEPTYFASSYFYIGGSTAAERNVISGNAANGIHFGNHSAGSIEGNYIGINAAGTAKLGNGANGVLGDNEILVGMMIGGAATGKGNIISGNNQNGIKLDGINITNENSHPLIKGNRIGTNPAGTAAIPNTQSGVYLKSKIIDVGGGEANEGNTISGNGGDGIYLAAGSSDNEIFGNRVGVNAAGTAILPNGGNGIFIASMTYSIGGSSSANAANIIGGNAGHGIFITDANGIYMNGNVQNNYIGTNAGGADLGNTGDGIRAILSSRSVRIGGAAANEANTIAFNKGDGVGLLPGFGMSPTAIRIQGNSIYSNSGSGIDLGPTDGITPNDPGDADTGANNLQNFPVLTKASSSQIVGSLNSKASQTFTIDFYRNTVCDGNGSGEGRFYLGSSAVTTDAGGNANFNLTGYNVAAGQIITATATDDDENTSEFSPCLTATPPPGTLAFTAATYSTSENSVNVPITVSRTNGSDGLVTVTYATSNGTATAGQDYPATTGTLVFLNGQTSATIFLPITNDTTDEPAETVNLTLSSPTGGAILGSQMTAVLTINDDDNPPAVSIGDVSKLEGNEGTTDFTLNVTLSEPSGFATSVNYATANGTANNTLDYQSKTGTVNFAAGETSKPVTIAVYGETLLEINETFSVNLSAPTLLTIADGQGIGTILDDDNPGKLSFSLAPYNAAESSGFATATVVRTNGTAGTVSVDYAANGGTATPFVDFTPVSDTLVFLDGETIKTFQIPILEDQIMENTETINLILSNPTGGASLGLAAAVVNILDNDNGASMTISGQIKKSDNAPLQNATVYLQGTQNLTAQTDTSGNFSFSGLTPGGSFSVTPSALGYTFVPIARQYPNLAATVTNANFTATPAPVRALRIAGGDTVAGQTATAIVELVAQGDENSIAFSLNYDTAILSVPNVSTVGSATGAFLTVNDSQIQNGRLGVIIALPAGQTFAAGTRQLVQITFSTAQTNVYAANLSFGDAPVQKQIVNANADPLTSVYTNGAITFAQGYEADVAPRPTGSGNGSVTVQDFTLIGNFVAGLATPDQLNEFQRADCAPRISKGDGQLRLSDYTQAGRYAAGLDAVQTAGGQTTASNLTSGENPASEALNLVQSPDAGRMIRVVNVAGAPGSQVLVQIQADAQGNENGFGFTLNYDPTKLGSPLVTAGANAAGATLIPNTLQTGKVGVVLAFPAGQTLAAGTNHLVTIRFNVAPGAATGLTNLTFGSAPVFQEIVDVNSDVLAANYADGAVNVLGTTAAGVSVSGRALAGNGRGISGAAITLTNAAGENRTVLTNQFGNFNFNDVEAGKTYVLTVNSKRYQFTSNSRVISTNEDAVGIIFTADN